MTTDEISTGFGIDGCSAPNHSCSLQGLARAMAWFASAEDRSDSASKAAVRLVNAMNTHPELVAGDVRLDTRSGRVTLDGEPVKLTAQEYKLLAYLMHHKGKVVSRTELIEHIYDQDFDRDSNTIEVFVTRIRKKLGADVITTIRGLGYSLDDPADAPRAS